MLLALLGVLFSCGSDDSDDMLSSDPIVGEWNLISLDYTGSSSVNDPYTGDPLTTDFEGVARDIMTTVIFNADGTFTSQGSYTIDLTSDFGGYEFTQSVPFEGFLGSGTWELDGTTMTTTNDQVEGESVIEILNLTDNSWNTNFVLSMVNTQQGITINQSIDGNYFFER